jgi:phosphoribosyl-AMP cyclohydrolase
LSVFHYFTPMFKKRISIFEIEEGNLLSPKFNNKGLIPVVTTNYKTGDVLMHGYMNREALMKTIETKEAHYWSRSRKSLWHKGKTSGFVQKVVEMRIDDDQDAVWMKVNIGKGASCHVGFISCFYRSITLGKTKNFKKIKIKFKEKNKKFDPDKVYKGQPNPTKL